MRTLLILPAVDFCLLLLLSCDLLPNVLTKYKNNDTAITEIISFFDELELLMVRNNLPVTSEVDFSEHLEQNGDRLWHHTGRYV